MLCVLLIEVLVCLGNNSTPAKLDDATCFRDFRTALAGLVREAVWVGSMSRRSGSASRAINCLLARGSESELDSDSNTPQLTHRVS